MSWRNLHYGLEEGGGGGVWWLIHCQLLCIFKVFKGSSILRQNREYPVHWPVGGPQHIPAGKKEAARGNQTYAGASSSCRIPIYRIIRSWTLCMNWPMQTWDSHVTTVQQSTDGIFLQRGQKKLSFSGRNIWHKAWSPNSHYPVCPIIDERQSPEILSIHLLFWPNDIWRMW